MTGSAVLRDAYASTSTVWVNVTNEGNCSLLRYVLYGVLRKKVEPYELSVAMLDEYVIEEKASVIVDSEVSEERSRYIPPPLFAEHEEKEEWVTETVLVEAPLTYTAPPFPDDAVHDVNVVFDSSVPVMDSVFPSPTVPQITAPFECVDEVSEREMFSNTHDVMAISAELSNMMIGLETVSTFEGARVTFVRLSFPEEIEKRE